jgi:hypothetical protein
LLRIPKHDNILGHFKKINPGVFLNGNKTRLAAQSQKIMETRYNIFKQAYHGLRAALYATAVSLQRTDFINPVEAAASLEKMNETLSLFLTSSLIENQIILPVVKQYEKVVAQSVEEERSKECTMSKKLKGLVDLYNRTSLPAEKSEISHLIIHTFAQFTAFVLTHLEKKEEQLNKVLLHHFNDKEIQQLKRMIVGRMSPGEIITWGKWIICGLNNAEVVTWLKEMQDYVSPDVFSTLYLIAEHELPASRFNMVMDGLSEGIMVVN